MIQTNDKQIDDSNSVAQSAGQVVHDIVVLSELQVELVKSDASESFQRIVRPLIIITLGGLLLLATLPVCLMTVALGLIEVGLPAVAAYAITAAISLAAAFAMLIWARQRLFQLPAAFIRSREEFARNVAWIKGALKSLSSNPQGMENRHPKRY